MVLQDRDLHFKSNFWSALWDLLGTKVLFTNAYHPQRDGQFEHAHHTMDKAVQCLLVELGARHDNWVKLLPFVEFAINANV